MGIGKTICLFITEDYFYFFQTTWLTYSGKKLACCFSSSLKPIINVTKLLWSWQGCVFVPFFFSPCLDLHPCYLFFLLKVMMDLWNLCLFPRCISVLVKQGYLDLAVEKKGKCFKLTLLSVRVVMSSSEALSSINTRRVSSDVIILCMIWTKACIFVPYCTNGSRNKCSALDSPCKGLDWYIQSIENRHSLFFFSILSFVAFRMGGNKHVEDFKWIIHWLKNKWSKGWLRDTWLICHSSPINKMVHHLFRCVCCGCCYATEGDSLYLYKWSQLIIL